MLKKEAFQILQLNPNADAAEITAAYRKLALKYHPDKCALPDANERFIEIREAYLTLTDDVKNKRCNDLSYASIFASFVKTVVKVWNKQDPDDDTRLYHLILSKVVGLCEKQALEYLQQIDRDKLAKLFVIAKMHADVFGFSSEFLTEFERIFQKGEEVHSSDIRRIYLNPLLEDILADNLYRLTWKSDDLIVPMWHHEMTFDVGETGLDVCCVPILPPNIELLEDNTLVITVNYRASALLQMDECVVEVGPKRLKISVEELRLVKEQCVQFEGQGVAAMNVDDVYDVSVRKPIRVKIVLS